MHRAARSPAACGLRLTDAGADAGDPFSQPFFELRVEQPVPVERLLSLGIEDVKTVAESTAAAVGVRCTATGPCSLFTPPPRPTPPRRLR